MEAWYGSSGLHKITVWRNPPGATQAFDEILHALCCTLNFCLEKYNDCRGDFWRAIF